jgi:hypothetical protein
MTEKSGQPGFVPDSLTSSPGDKLPRQYHGVNAQLKYKMGWGFSELRGEIWKGTQTGTQQSSETPNSVMILPDGKYLPFYIRPFKGGFIYYLQNIVNNKHQVMLKYDWYDPNTAVSGKTIGGAGTNLGEADIRFSTLGAGYLYHFNENLKVVFYYEWVKNEMTLLNEYTIDKPDNIFTVRAQFRF